MKSSVVYIIGARNISRGDHCKIGFSTNVERRLASLRCSSSVDLCVLRSVPGDIAVERWFHVTFADSRLSREWFSFTDEMMTVQPPDVAPEAASVIELFAVSTKVEIDRDWETQFSDALRASVNADGHGARRLSSDINCEKRTAEHYLRGTYLPNMAALLQMMATYPAVAEVVIRLIKNPHSERIARAMSALEMARRELQTADDGSTGRRAGRSK